jgi:transcriptional regulator with XRE-family HTH domain
MRSADLIREARLRAGLSQHELAARSGRERSVIARWEQGVVSPSLEAVLEVIRVCGFELPLEFVPRDEAAYEQLRENALLSPERRVHRLLKKRSPQESFQPYAILAALERQRATYVVVGAFGRIIHGAEETTDGLDIAPSLRGGTLDRIQLALEELGATRADGGPPALDEASIRDEPIVEFRSPKGELKIVAEPAGTRGGYDDLRRAATREPIGKGLRPTVASTPDLARMLAALGREEDIPKLLALRRLVELERRLGPELGV